MDQATPRSAQQPRHKAIRLVHYGIELFIPVWLVKVLQTQHYGLELAITAGSLSHSSQTQPI